MGYEDVHMRTGGSINQVGARLFLDPNASVQGRGYWTGKYNPKDRQDEEARPESNVPALRNTQSTRNEHEVVHYYEEEPDVEDATIKSKAVHPHHRAGKKVRGYIRGLHVATFTPDEFKSLSNRDLFSIAKAAVSKKDTATFELVKAENTRRIWKAKKATAVKALAGGAGVAAGAGPQRQGGAGESKAASKDKKVFNATHGVNDDETSTSDKEDLTAEKTMPEPPLSGATGDLDKAALVRDMKKAIGTKPSSEKGPKAKAAKPNPRGKVTATKNGKKNYDYRGKASPKSAKVNPKSSTKVGPAQSGGGQMASSTPPPREVNPENLAHQLQVPVATLAKLAEKKSRQEFSNYFKQKGAAFVRKYKIPDEYWDQLYGVLRRNVTKSEETFTVNPGVYKKGTEMRTTAARLVSAEVTTLPKLATFLLKSYELSKKEASRAAAELHSALVEDGAIRSNHKEQRT